MESTAGRGSGWEGREEWSSWYCKQVTDSEPRTRGGGGKKGLGARMINKCPLWRTLLCKRGFLWAWEDW